MNTCLFQFSCNTKLKFSDDYINKTKDIYKRYKRENVHLSLEIKDDIIFLLNKKVPILVVSIRSQNVRQNIEDIHTRYTFIYNGKSEYVGLYYPTLSKEINIMVCEILLLTKIHFQNVFFMNTQDFVFEETEEIVCIESLPEEWQYACVRLNNFFNYKFKMHECYLYGGLNVKYYKPLPNSMLEEYHLICWDGDNIVINEKDNIKSYLFIKNNSNNAFSCEANDYLKLYPLNERDVCCFFYYDVIYDSLYEMNPVGTNLDLSLKMNHFFKYKYGIELPTIVTKKFLTQNGHKKNTSINVFKEYHRLYDCKNIEKTAKLQIKRKFNNFIKKNNVLLYEKDNVIILKNYLSNVDKTDYLESCYKLICPLFYAIHSYLGSFYGDYNYTSSIAFRFIINQFESHENLNAFIYVKNCNLINNKIDYMDIVDNKHIIINFKKDIYVDEFIKYFNIKR